MAKIAILGFGTVGGGVLEVLRRNAASVSRRAGQPVEVKYILDIRDFSNHPNAALFVDNIDTILADPEIKVVVETIGGTKFAYPYVRKALESGRSVVTSNKEMVATYGAELLALAREHKVAFLFEASVGGGTPIITPMHQCLAANVISQVQGIVNGTTNFMLTKMAWAKRDETGRVTAAVEPMLVPRSNQLAGVDDVFNAVLVKGDMLGDVVFYGKGAGRLPTASAVVADVIDALKHGAKIHDSLFWQPSEPFDGLLEDPTPATCYVRVKGLPATVLPALYGEGELVSDDGSEAAYLVTYIAPRGLEEAARKVTALGGKVELVLRQLTD